MKGAATYARLGWAVVPLHDVAGGACSCPKGAACPSAGKHPRLNAWQNEASADATQIAAWAAQWPTANVGVATGKASGFFVLDVDGEIGRASLDALEAEHGKLPRTTEAVTGSGGTHYLFALPGFSVANSASRVGYKLDVRGDGGQIVVAPSVSGKGSYRWVSPPWALAPVPAPAWLLERLQQAPATRSASTPKPGASIDRGFFPAASPEVLDRAEQALEAHGPAVEGEGGDQHTFVAAALLTHDFALTEDEAWPLLWQWNTTCEPPWSEVDLAAKLRGGGKYATGAYGSKRSMDSRAVALKMIADWQAKPDGDPIELIKRVRELTFVDPAERELVLNDLEAATGLGSRAIALPKATPAADALPPRGTLEVTTQINADADRAIAAIAPKVFQRGGVLCEITKNERTTIADLETPRIQDLMASAGRWIRKDPERGIVEQVAPMAVAVVVGSRRQHPASVRVIESVTSSPIFLADGSILQAPGYNAQARVFLEPDVEVNVLEEPSREDAREAVALFWDLLGDFSFRERADFSTWLAAVLSPLVKSATRNAPAPLFLISASSPGAGKTLLTDLVARVVTGSGAEVRPYNPRDVAEWGKRLTSFVKAASPVSVFDNVNGPIGDEGLDRLITSSTWSDRILGASNAPPLPNVTTWLATGNNVEPVGDTVRRSAVCRIDVDVERPQERTDFERPALADYVDAHRPELLSAALTILRAYHVAGRPKQALPPWGSFNVWSDLVRGALVWAGQADPFLTQQRAAAEFTEGDNDAHDFWIDVVNGSDGRGASIAASANARGAREILNLRDDVTPFNLKKFLQRFLDKPRRGLRITRERDADGARYLVSVIQKRAS